jgi:hypothetical protein
MLFAEALTLSLALLSANSGGNSVPIVSEYLMIPVVLLAEANSRSFDFVPFGHFAQDDTLNL